MTTDPFAEAANAAAREYARTPRMNVGTVRDRIGEAHADGWEAARSYLATQEPVESVLMDSHEEQIADRLSDAGYTEYAEDEDGGLTWVSAPLGEVLRIVSAAHQPIEDASARAVRSWRAMYQVAERRADEAEAKIERLENRAASETARADAWREKHRVMAKKRDAAHRARQAEREARRKAEARIQAVEDVLAAWHVEPGESGLADDLLRALNT